MTTGTMNKKIALVAITAIALIGAAVFGRYLFRATIGVGPILEIGTRSWGWGGALNTVCSDGRIFYGNRLMAVLDEQEMADLETMLGDSPFHYEEDFDDPMALDDEYTAIARREAPGNEVRLTKSDFDAYRQEVLSLIEENQVFIGHGAVSLSRSGYGPLVEWADADTFDLPGYLREQAEPADDGSDGQGPAREVRAMVMSDELTEEVRTFFKGLYERHIDALSEDMGSVFFYMPGDMTVVYEVSVPVRQDTGEVSRVYINSHSAVMPLSMLSDALGISESEMVSILESWRRGEPYKEFDLDDGGFEKLAALSVSGGGKDDGYLRLIFEADGKPYFTKVRHYMKSQTEDGTVSEGVTDVCGLPWPKKWTVIGTD